MTPAQPSVHPVLARQLRRLHLAAHQLPNQDSWASLLQRITAAYTDSDQQRYLAERSLELSMEEMHDLNTELATARHRLEAVFDSASVGLCVLDDVGRIESINPGAEVALGMNQADIIGQHIWQVMTIRAEPNGIVLDRQNFELTAQAAQAWHIDDASVVCGTRTFSANCVLTPLATSDDATSGAVLMILDTTARKKAQADLAWRARNDALTGLANRETLVGRMSAVLHARSFPVPESAVVFIDLDRFKSINDTLGHASGDELLMLAASRIAVTVRSTDVVGRWSGDEFIIFCTQTSRMEALAISHRVLEELTRPFSIAGGEVRISASIGVSISRPDATASSLVAEADAAMYEAKESGRGAICIFDDNVRQLTTRRLFLEQQLRHAIATHGTSVAFQPQLELGSGKLLGFELLSRWTMADGSVVHPVEFIPIAEETGLIHDLGWNVLESAANSAAAWGQAVPNLSLAVNVSSRQLQRSDFVDRLQRLIGHHQLAPGALTVEITESVLLDDPDNALARLRRVRELGVRLAIDDFGTGYSSLSYLRRLPINDVKIDREFIVDLTSSAAGRTIVDAVVRMCHALDYRVIAEGVETEEQARLLSELGCDVGQGWIFGRPAPEETARNIASEFVTPEV